MSLVRDLARLSHEVNRTYCSMLGDDSQPRYEDLPREATKSLFSGVRNHATGVYKTAKDSHEGWLALKRADGWTYGPVKDVEAKTHPCFREFHELPADQQSKSHLCGAVCRAGNAVLADPEWQGWADAVSVQRLADAIVAELSADADLSASTTTELSAAVLETLKKFHVEAQRGK
jgi:hypothetical protein